MIQLNITFDDVSLNYYYRKVIVLLMRRSSDCSFWFIDVKRNALHVVPSEQGQRHPLHDNAIMNWIDPLRWRKKRQSFLYFILVISIFFKISPLYFYCAFIDVLFSSPFPLLSSYLCYFHPNIIQVVFSVVVCNHPVPSTPRQQHSFTPSSYRKGGEAIFSRSSNGNVKLVCSCLHHE